MILLPNIYFRHFDNKNESKSPSSSKEAVTLEEEGMEYVGGYMAKKLGINPIKMKI